MAPQTTPSSDETLPDAPTLDNLEDAVPDPVARVRWYTRWGRDIAGGAGTLPPAVAARRDRDLVLARATVETTAELATEVELSRGRVSWLLSRALGECQA